MCLLLFLLVVVRLLDKPKLVEYLCLEATKEWHARFFNSGILEEDIENGVDVDKETIYISKLCAGLQLALSLAKGIIKDVREEGGSIRDALRRSCVQLESRNNRIGQKERAGVTSVDTIVVFSRKRIDSQEQRACRFNANKGFELFKRIDIVERDEDIQGSAREGMGKECSRCIKLC